MAAEVQVTARVQITVEISVGDTWGPECSLSQVHNQAVEAALHQIERAFSGTEGRRALKWRVISTPIPIAVIATRGGPAEEQDVKE